jgi:hypothetical protein
MDKESFKLERIYTIRQLISIKIKVGTIKKDEALI